MKTNKFILLITSLLVFGQISFGQNTLKTKKIRVGVFDGHGGAQTCIWETVEAIKLDAGMLVRTITSAEIANNVLDSLDVIVIPGGGGSRQYLNLGGENHTRIKKFIAQGKGAVGICAGAYFFSNTPSYASIAINGAKAIDIEHDNRGHGITKLTLNKEGKEIFPELSKKDTLYITYYEGPVFVPAENDSIKYNTVAIMQSDVHEEGYAPSNMTNNKPFFITNTYGKGKVFSSIAHPEATPGMLWMIPRMVRWAANAPLISYKKEVINTELFNKEILMSKEMLDKEASMYKIFLYGSADEKINALDWLQSVHSWDAKRWIQGLVYDSNPKVRVRAAKYIADKQYLKYLPDVQAAYNSEKDKSIKNELKIHLDKLKNLLP